MTWGWPVWRNPVSATVVREACVSDILGLWRTRGSCNLCDLESVRSYEVVVSWLSGQYQLLKP